MDAQNTNNEINTSQPSDAPPRKNLSSRKNGRRTKLIIQLGINAILLYYCSSSDNESAFFEYLISNIFEFVFGKLKFLIPISISILNFFVFKNGSKRKKFLIIFGFTLFSTFYYAELMNFSSGILGELAMYLISNTFGNKAYSILVSVMFLYTIYLLSNFVINAMSGINLKIPIIDKILTENEKFIFPTPIKSLSNKNANDTLTGKINKALKKFKIEGNVDSINDNYSFMSCKLNLSDDERLGNVKKIEDELAFTLGYNSIEIMAEKGSVFINIPKDQREVLYFSQIEKNEIFYQDNLSFPIGRNMQNRDIFANFKNLVHTLIAGTTGSGKTSLLDCIICSLVKKNTPSGLNLLIIDLKNKLSKYNQLPHLMTNKIVTTSDEALFVLESLVEEMEKRYDGTSLNMQPIILIIDEFEELIETSQSDVENCIARLARKSREANIYLILATQNPISDVVTSKIKQCLPSRIALSVASNSASRVILDHGGAEKLLGQGDMLFLPANKSTPERLQGYYVSENEIEKIIVEESSKYEKSINDFYYDSDNIIPFNTLKDELLNFPKEQEHENNNKIRILFKNESTEKILLEAIKSQKISINWIMKNFKLNYNKAEPIYKEIESLGIIVESNAHNKPNSLSISSIEEWEFIKNNITTTTTTK